jgi:lipid-A-disaccharide synthase-like uncharacterized protein
VNELIRQVREKLLSELEVLLIVVVTYLIAFAIVQFGISKIQTAILDDNSSYFYASLIFLPHGVRLLAAFLLGARSIFPLFVASLAGQWLFFNPEPYAFWALLPGCVSCYLAIRLIALTGIQFIEGPINLVTWRQLMLIGFLGAVLNGLGIMVVYLMNGASELSVLPRLFVYILGDTVGALVLLVGFLIVRRFMKASQNRV